MEGHHNTLFKIYTTSFNWIEISLKLNKIILSDWGIYKKAFHYDWAISHIINKLLSCMHSKCSYYVQNTEDTNGKMYILWKEILLTGCNICQTHHSRGNNYRSSGISSRLNNNNWYGMEISLYIQPYNTAR